MQNTTVESLFLVTFSDFFTIFRYSTEATKKTVPEITRTVRCKLSGNLLFQADPREVIVPVPDLRMVGFDGLSVILALGLFVVAFHAENCGIVHAHDPAAIQRLTAPIAVLNFKKSVSHCYNSFC
jgi:hypothetical protein